MSNFLDRVLAVDIGTSSVRAVVFDRAGEIFARSQISYSTVRPAPYFEEQDPDMVRREVYRAIAECLAKPEAVAGQIGAIGFSSQLYGIIALDAEDKPLTRNIVWSDGRAEAQAEALKASHGNGWLYPETGCPTNSIFPLAKLVWLRETLPSVFKSSRRFVSIKEYVMEPLIGEWAVDHSMASATGLFDIRKHRWHSGALDAAEVSEWQLSAPVSCFQGFSLRNGSPISSCGLPPEVKVFLGGGDGPLASLGSGAWAPGAINIDLGTSGAARCVVTEPVTDDNASLWCFCLTADLWVYGGIVTNVGNAYQWLGANVLAAQECDTARVYEHINQLAGKVSPGADGLFFLPYLRKVRAPYWDGRLKGALYGLTADHNVGHMAHAMLEAIAYDLRTIIDLMRKRCFAMREIVLTGGLSRSPVIPQMLADVLNEEIFVPDDSEGSVAGAAILALRGLGLIDGLFFEGNRRAGRVSIPQASSCSHYESLYRGYVHLVGALRSFELQ